MTDTVKLLSVKGRAQLIERFYFYDGEVAISDGVVEVPLDKPEWVQRAYIMGYRFNPENEAPITLAEALAGGATQEPVVTDESTESAGETSEGTDTGGQSLDADGVRESEPEGGASLPEGELGSSDGDGATVRGEGDDASDNSVQPAEVGPDGDASSG